VTLLGLLLQQPSRFGLASTLWSLSYGLPQRCLQRSLLTGLNKVTDAHTEALREQPQRLHCGISDTPLQFGKESGCDDIGGSLNLREPLEPPSSPYIDANESSESVEIHVSSRTRAVLLLETNKRTIIVDRQRSRSDSFGEYSCRRGEL